MKWFDPSSITGPVLRVLLFSLVLLIAEPVSTAFADSLREVAERVARQNDAKLVSAREVTDRDGRTVYVIRILTRDGVVRTIRVPARDRHRLTDQNPLLKASGHWQMDMHWSADDVMLSNPQFQRWPSTHTAQGV